MKKCQCLKISRAKKAKQAETAEWETRSSGPELHNLRPKFSIFLLFWPLGRRIFEAKIVARFQVDPSMFLSEKVGLDCCARLGSPRHSVTKGLPATISNDSQDFRVLKYLFGSDLSLKRKKTSSWQPEKKWKRNPQRSKLSTSKRMLKSKIQAFKAFYF